jgi:hypothetical protein
MSFVKLVFHREVNPYFIFGSIFYCFPMSDLLVSSFANLNQTFMYILLVRCILFGQSTFWIRDLFAGVVVYFCKAHDQLKLGICIWGGPSFAAAHSFILFSLFF